MVDRIRFHLNEHVDPAIAAALRRAGIDVTTTVQAGLRTQDDEAHLRFARDEGRVIVDPYLRGNAGKRDGRADRVFGITAREKYMTSRDAPAELIEGADLSA